MIKLHFFLSCDLYFEDLTVTKYANFFRHKIPLASEKFGATITCTRHKIYPRLFDQILEVTHY